MLRNYLITAIRNIVRHRLNAAINIAGLAVGLAVTILVTLSVQHEYSFDRMYADSDRIYRLNWISTGTGDRFATMFNPSSPLMAERLPEIEMAARFGVFDELLAVDDFRQIEAVGYADPDFFRIFEQEFIGGAPETLFEKPLSLVITESAAVKYFGTTAALGRVIQLNGEFDLEVVGVIRDLPANTHFTANFITTIEALRATTGGGGFLENPYSDVVFHYIKLKEGPDAVAFEARLTDFWANEIGIEDEPFFEIAMQPLTDIHFTPDLQNEMPVRDEITGIAKPQREKSDLAIFVGGALLTLGIACFNFMNLQIAQATRRVREVGVRKVLGASRYDVAAQFLIESMMLSLIALGGALVIIELALGSFNAYANTALTSVQLMAPAELSALVGTALLVGLASGLYPALFLAGFMPARILHGEMSGVFGAAKIRAGLVILQFSIAIGFFISSGVVSGQIEYALSKPLGYEPEQIITVDLTRQAGRSYETLQERLLRHSGVLEVTASSIAPTGSLSDGGGFKIVGGDPEYTLATRRISTDYGFFDTYGMTMAAGRRFSREFGHDFGAFPTPDNPSVESNLILNETAARDAGWPDPTAAVGQRIYSEFERNGVLYHMDYTIIGVVADAHFRSIRSVIPPLSFTLFPDRRVLALRVAEAETESAIAHLEALWPEFEPAAPIRWSFLDEEYAALYAGEKRMRILFSVLGFVALAVAGVGLFGLASYIAETRVKEIGIRKVLGATVSNIVWLLSWEFVRLALIANVIAWPVAYLFLSDWLNGFAYRADIGWLPFVTAGLMAAGLAAASTSARAFMAARQNPIISLRHE